MRAALELDPHLHLGCGSCGAALELEPTEKATVCPYCASPHVVERPPAPDRPRPHFVVAFTVGEDEARAAAQRWVQRHGAWAPSALKKPALDQVRAVYSPAYLYGATAHTRYRVEIGQRYQERKNNKTRTKTEWRRLSGRHSGYVRDLVVTASKAIDNAELEAVEPFDLSRMRRYTPAVVSGWVAEEASLSQEDCLALGAEEARGLMAARLSKFMPGDEHRDLAFETRLEDVVLELVLVPLWVFAVRYHEDKPPVRILVNGQTARTAGKLPVSAAKVAAAVGAVLALILGIWGYLQLGGGS